MKFTKENNHNSEFIPLVYGMIEVCYKILKIILQIVVI